MAIAIPAILVSPPLDTYTNLNYDIMKNKINKTLDTTTKNDLVYKLAEEILNAESNYLNDLFYVEENKAENWYLGKSNESIPINKDEYKSCKVCRLKKS